MPTSPTAVPTPYSLNPTDKWDGIDGNWTTFQISIGTPAQDFRVLVSTRGSAAWVPDPDFCNHEGVLPNCPDLRGINTFLRKPSPGFQSTKSASWAALSIYDLILESDHGFTGNGIYGFDNFSMDHDGNDDSLALNNTLVVGMNSTSYWMGLLGIGVSKTSLVGNDIDSLISNLKRKGSIPSLIYGYTAGAIYQYNGVAGSLVLGGYDQSRFEFPRFNFTFAKATDNTLRVGIQDITTSAHLGLKSEKSLLPSGPGGSGLWASIDSTLPEIWLPRSVCAKFEEAFGLVYNDTYQIYLVNDTLHEKLMMLNPSLTLRLGDKIVPNENHTSITLPYAAFDLWKTTVIHEFPSLRDFPLRRALYDNQSAIGRVFLQEAYLVVDHEREQFSLSQAIFKSQMPPPDIRRIDPVDIAGPSNDQSLGAAVKACIGLAVVLAVSLIVTTILFSSWWKHRREKRGKLLEEISAIAKNINPLREMSGKGIEEMPAGRERHPELEGTRSITHELGTNYVPGVVHEMEGDAAGERNGALDTMNDDENILRERRNQDEGWR